MILLWVVKGQLGESTRSTFDVGSIDRRTRDCELKMNTKRNVAWLIRYVSLLRSIIE